jgi:hypothetical protein
MGQRLRSFVMAYRNTRSVVSGLLWTGLAVAALSVSGCASASRALGVAKTTPDEFRVVTKAPLVLPPDYALRPPAPGQPRPQELRPDSQARAALLGQETAVTRTQGEQLLVAKAGVARADPLIRYVVDDEFGDIAHKEKSFVDRLMVWKTGDPTTPIGTPAPGATESAPLDAAAEEDRAARLTGANTVVISRGGGRAIKLPGL